MRSSRENVQSSNCGRLRVSSWVFTWWVFALWAIKQKKKGFKKNPRELLTLLHLTHANLVRWIHRGNYIISARLSTLRSGRRVGAGVSARLGETESAFYISEGWCIDVTVLKENVLPSPSSSFTNSKPFLFTTGFASFIPASVCIQPVGVVHCSAWLTR